MVGASTIQKLTKYLQNLHNMLTNFYPTNGLITNLAKMMILLVSPNKVDIIQRGAGFDDNCQPTVVKYTNQIKILGFWTNKFNNVSCHLTNVRSNVANSLRILAPHLRNMSMRTRSMIVNAKVIRKLDYGIALYCG